jgi:hypothetical protein
MPNIKVMHFGLGPIGAAIVKQVASRPGFKIVGAVDIDPATSSVCRGVSVRKYRAMLPRH